MYNPKFRNPSTFLIGGVSQSGKTTFTFKLLENIDKLFIDPRCKQNVLYFYNSWQESFDAANKKKLVKEWLNKVPTTQDVKDKTTPYKNKGGSVIIIDDFAERLTKDTVEIFSVLAHHTNTVVILLAQNIFSKNKAFRDISLGSTYVVLFRNPRDGSQISRFASQIAPGKVNSNAVVAAFREATKSPYKYLLFDLHQETDDRIRLRTNVLPDEWPVKTFVPKSKMTTV